MTKNILTLFLLFCTISTFAFQSDTSAYHIQRLKVNALLKERSAKFGQYDESLDDRSGIFGLQTKEDVKKSNEILRLIVLNDNNVFKELKILMDYKDRELKLAQSAQNKANDRLQNYTATIKNLQDENERLNDELNGRQKGNNVLWYVMVILIAALVYLAFTNGKLKSKV